MLTGKRDERMSGNAGQDAKAMILVGELKPGKSGFPRPPGGHDDDDSRWSRFMEHVLAAFREPRAPLGGTLSGRKADDDDDQRLELGPRPGRLKRPPIRRRGCGGRVSGGGSASLTTRWLRSHDRRCPAYVNDGDAG